MSTIRIVIHFPSNFLEKAKKMLVINTKNWLKGASSYAAHMGSYLSSSLFYRWFIRSSFTVMNRKMTVAFMCH